MGELIIYDWKIIDGKKTYATIFNRKDKIYSKL